jgi:protein ImuB
VDRTACIDLPALPLQLLLRRHPEWHRHPAAVVDSDRPQGKLLWVNERARASGILPGTRYAAALSLAGSLQAAEVPEQEIRRSIDVIARWLRRFTPHVESSLEDPGVFWLDASGLERLYRYPAQWVRAIHAAMQNLQLHSVLVVGFSRFGSYALAKSAWDRAVVAHPDEEKAAVRRVPLNRLAMEPEVRDALHKLGVRTLGHFMDLPLEGISRRFGPETHRLHELATGRLRPPLQPQRPPAPASKRRILDDAETHRERLLVGIEQLLGELLETLAHRAHALTHLRLQLKFEQGLPADETLQPAEATLDAAQLLQLLRLRLESVRFPEGVVEILLQARSKPVAQDQMQLFARRPRRDRTAAERALARIRADLGNEAVVQVRLQDGHLPEARYRWEPLTALSEPSPRGADGKNLVRRIYARPQPLPPRGRREPDGWMLRGLEHGPVVRIRGPYILSGGWWNRTQHREYHFAETQAGELLWIYYDRIRRRWFLQGRVE